MTEVSIVSRLTRNPRCARLLVVLLPIAVACSLPVYDIQEVIQARSCTDDAVTMLATVGVSGILFDVGYDGGSANIIGTPLLVPNAGNLLLVADLDDVDLGEAVTLRYHAKVSTAFLSVTTTDILFFTMPWEQYPPACSAAEGPSFQIALDPIYDLLLRVSNPGPLPLTIVVLELAEASLLSPEQLDWEDPVFNALPWHAAVLGGTILDGASPPLAIDLPDELTGGGAVLCRVVSLYDGHEVKGIVQVNVTGSPVAARTTTWGAVKALYR